MVKSLWTKCKKCGKEEEIWLENKEKYDLYIEGFKNGTLIVSCKECNGSMMFYNWSCKSRWRYIDVRTTDT
jgi:hypothetical protein